MNRPATTATTADTPPQKTKLQIISRLWSHIYDLLLYIKGSKNKSVYQIQQEIDLTERYCRPYADCDDDEFEWRTTK